MRRIGRLELVSFVTGFSLMAFEMVAARILAPSIGSSTYVWTSVIGVIIAALSMGYWVGGMLADKRKAHSDVVWLIMFTAAMVVLTRVSYQPTLEWIVAGLPDARLQAVGAAILLFAPASFLLGMISPYLAKLNITSVSNSGSKVASLSALNSVGGIAGTFATGFVLFGYIGSRETLGIVVALLLFASWLLIPRYRLRQRIMLSAVLVLAILLPSPMPKGVTDIDTPSAHYQVVNYNTPSGEVTGLVTGPTGIQSAVFNDYPSIPVFWYVRELERIITLQKPSKILVLGGGAFTLPQYLATSLPESQIDVVEIDPELKAISETYFRYENPTNVQLIFEDARTYINRTAEQYDAIVVDVYGDSSIPFSLMTREFAQKLAARTTDNGIVYVNLVAGVTGPCREVFSAIDSAYREQFAYGLASNESGATEDWANYILAYARNQMSVAGMNQLTAFNGRVFTDNYAPAERLNFACRQAATS